MSSISFFGKVLCASALTIGMLLVIAPVAGLLTVATGGAIRAGLGDYAYAGFSTDLMQAYLVLYLLLVCGIMGYILWKERTLHETDRSEACYLGLFPILALSLPIMAEEGVPLELLQVGLVSLFWGATYHALSAREKAGSTEGFGSRAKSRWQHYGFEIGAVSISLLLATSSYLSQGSAPTWVSVSLWIVTALFSVVAALLYAMAWAINTEDMYAAYHEESSSPQ